MFTGIVEEMGVVRTWAPPRLQVSARIVLSDLRVGDSIAINGACLTVVRRDRWSFEVELSPETVRRTNLGMLQPGDRVNLERAVPVGGRLGGHLVQGHVEGIAHILSLEPEGETVWVRFSIPDGLGRYIVPKGFIAVDGVSLTVVEVDATWFSVMLVPYTRDHTTLGLKRPGDPVNIETDVVGRYIERLLHHEGYFPSIQRRKVSDAVGNG
jgi:riboflavin synthase